MLNAQFRPLPQWPGERTGSGKRAHFRTKYEQTLDRLEYELGKLQARDTIIQVDNLTINDIRNDGWPRGGWQPRGGNQGVVVSFDSPKGAMSFPCDRYSEWRHNLHAIALSLEALRAVDRHGVTMGNEQYRGWARLEAPNGNGKMDRESALRFIEALAGAPFGPAVTREIIADVCRALKIRHHPDRGGSHDTFVKIGQAEEVLDAQ
jgi:hypothetical protein